jgi:hypothetical protein
MRLCTEYLTAAQLLTPLQYARLMVAAAPCSVDSITIVNLLAADEENGGSPTDVLMGQMAEVCKRNLMGKEFSWEGRARHVFWYHVASHAHVCYCGIDVS